MKSLNFLKLIISINNFIYILVFFLFLSCQKESNYSKVLKRELGSGKVYNDLIFDLKIGQTKDDYFNICYELNRKKLITSGGR